MNARTTSLSLFAALLLPLACAIDDGGLEGAGPDGSAGGKADGFGDACPADVTLNSARGTAKRCINPANGQFVATACCADVCEGAGWREQSNGTRCAWLAEPGLDGAKKGQFAPELCCDLQDAMACGRGSVRDGDGACIDSADPSRKVSDACCDEEPVECSPLVRSELRDCVTQVRFDHLDDPELPFITAPQALELCLSEGDLVGPMKDRICQFHPDSVVCDVDFETFMLSHVAACTDELSEELDCALGLSFGDIRAPQPNLVIQRELRLFADDIPTFTEDMVAQMQAAFALHHDGQQLSIEEVFDNVDGSEINYVELWEGSNGQAYAAVEFGLGDNGFGAIFEYGTTKIAVEIVDSDHVAPASGAFECGPGFGDRWNTCGSSDDCAAGLSCQGRADVPGLGNVGKCVDDDLGAETGRLDDACGGDDGTCPFEDGLVCSGLGANASGDFGFCRSVWATTLLRDDAIVDIPDDGSVERTVHAYGLATVPEDAILELAIEHPDFSQVRIEMDDAGGEDFVTIFDGSVDADLASLPETSGFITLVRNVPHSGDDEVNGAWTLRVSDREAGGEGAILDWSLRLTSRFD